MPMIRARHDVFGVQDVPDNQWYRENGWTPVDPSTPTETDRARQQEADAYVAATGGGAFDPGAHTVQEVLSYLETADDAEHERVLDAEQAGKARTTILTADEA